MIHAMLAAGLPQSALMGMIGGGGAVALVAVIYGLLRKFSRMSWFAYQVLLLFAVSLLVPLVAKTGNSIADFCIAVGILFGGAALILLAGHFNRRAMILKKNRAPGIIRFFDRLLGVVTVVLNIVVYALCVGGFVLVILSAVLPSDTMGGFFQSELWMCYGARYALDLPLVALCMIFVRAGYRMGLIRFIEVVAVLALTMLSVFGAALFVLNVGFMRSLMGVVAGWFSKLGGIAASMLSFLIVMGVTAILFFTVLMVLTWLFNKLVIKLHSVKVLDAIDGSILSIAFFAVFVALACGFDFLMSYLAGNPFAAIAGSNAALEGLAGIGETVANIAASISNAIAASSCSGVIFANNPLLLFFS